jgi:hypothetical protein
LLDLFNDTSKGHGVTPGRSSALTPVPATALYVAVAVVFTWPLVLGLGRDIPWDLGDSLLNAWILAWDADHIIRVLSGDPGALRGFWNANIFHPEPLTLAYSEHLVAQAVQIVPFYAATGNIILCYNLLFLSTFVLSGLGMYLFVREITGSPRAGFAAGLIYAFAPYRVPQFAHLQVLSSHWMPFALYGLRRFFETRRRTPLAGAALALIAQNLSNGYFLLFFSPVVLLYVLFEIGTRRLWRDVRVWASVAAAGLLVTAATLPFLLPYLELRRLGFPPRSLLEVATYSADVFSYGTAPPESHVWGRAMRAYPKPEGDLFPTLTAIALAVCGAAVAAQTAWRETAGAARIARGLKPVAYVLLAIGAIYFALLVLVFAGLRFDRLGPLPISLRGIGRPLLAVAICLGALAAISARMRAFVRLWTGTPAGLAVLFAALAFVLSLGPDIRANGRLIGEAGPYALLYTYVPGFDGLRVPARYAMLVILFLAIVGGFGSAAIERTFRWGGTLVVALGLLAVVEAYPAPIVLNGSAAEAGYAAPPPRVHTNDEVPAVYRFLGTLPAGQTVVVEFPFGETAYELRYMFYSINHWHPLLNGYSGTFPTSYGRGSALLHRPLNAPDLAWQSIRDSGATHAVVHEGLYLNREGRDISLWLVRQGARQVAGFDGDRVFQLKVDGKK